MLIAIVMRWMCSGGCEVDGVALDGVRAVGLLAQEARCPVGGGRLVVEDEVLVWGDLALRVGEEQGEVGVCAAEPERDGQPFARLIGQRGRRGRLTGQGGAVRAG
ncbi:hypothetical protein Scani_32460 [Streptomyces caniferus]|uniref:Uncharacterized protein n=1 Tax=Streptomyces caniferus TaxID=285557 RepID=A0A640S7D4_9ACTN|nr:hypothetical protein Scani_32460 [Streptomyces caniferus]